MIDNRIEPSSSEMCLATWYLSELLAFFLRIVHFFVILNAVKNCKICKNTIYFYDVYTFKGII